MKEEVWSEKRYEHFDWVAHHFRPLKIFGMKNLSNNMNADSFEK